MKKIHPINGKNPRSNITPRYRDLFRNMCDTDRKRVDAAFDAVLFDREHAVPALIEQYKLAQDRPQLRYFCVQLLGFNDTQEVIPTLLKALNDSEPAIRIEALYALEDQCCYEALDRIQTRTGDIDSEVRTIASEVFHTIKKAM